VVGVGVLVVVVVVSVVLREDLDKKQLQNTYFITRFTQ